MNKADHQNLLSIGQLSKILEVKEHTIRFWEKEFDFVQPTRLSNGRRKYSYADLAVLKKIRELLYQNKFTIKGALQYFQDHPSEIHVISTQPLFEDSKNLKQKVLDENRFSIEQSNQIFSSKPLRKNLNVDSQINNKDFLHTLDVKITNIINEIKDHL